MIEPMVRFYVMIHVMIEMVSDICLHIFTIYHELY